MFQIILKQNGLFIMKKLFLAACLTLAASTATASGINMTSGISVIPDTNIDADTGNGNFNNGFEFIQWWDDTTTADKADSIAGFNPGTASNYVLQGIGEVFVSQTAANDTGKLSCNGCELTFKFGGIKVDVGQILNPVLVGLWQQLTGNPGFPTEAELVAFVNANPGFNMVPFFVPGPIVDTSAAFLHVYADSTPNLDFGALFNDGLIDATEESQATDGTLWLALDFNESLFSPGNAGDGVFGLSRIDSFFSFDVAGTDAATGGTAFESFEDNSIREVDNLLTSFADLVGIGLTSTFAFDANTGTYDLYAINGTGSISGIAVSAPANVAILGLGLFGLAFAARRKAK